MADFIDLRTPGTVGQSLSEFAEAMKEMFGNEDQKALSFAMKNPQMAMAIARSARAARDAGMEFQGAVKPEIVRGLVKLFPATPEEEQVKLQNAQLKGPQQFAAQELKQGIDLPEATPAQVAWAQLQTTPGVTQDMLLAAAPQALEKHRKSMAMRAALVTGQSLFDPKEFEQFKAGVTYLEMGGDPVVADLIMPKDAKYKLELLSLEHTVNEQKSTKEADIVATPWMIKHKYASPGSVYIPGAAAFVASEVSKIRSDARQRAMQIDGTMQERMKAALHGEALLLAASNPTWSGKQVMEGLRKMPIFAAITDGEIASVALNAPNEIARMASAPTEGIARARVLVEPAKIAVTKINEFDAQGKTLTAWKANLATMDDNMLRGAGFGLGYFASRLLGQHAAAQTAMNAAGSGAGTPAAQILGPGGAKQVATQAAKKGGSLLPKVGTAVAGSGAIVGGITIAAMAPAITRGIAIASMTSDEQEMFNAAQALIAAAAYTESGKKVQPEEWRRAVTRFIPTSLDDEAGKKIKREMRAAFVEQLQRNAGLSIDAWKAEQEKFFNNANATLDAANVYDPTKDPENVQFIPISERIKRGLPLPARVK